MAICSFIFISVTLENQQFMLHVRGKTLLCLQHRMLSLSIAKLLRKQAGIYAKKQKKRNSNYFFPFFSTNLYANVQSLRVLWQKSLGFINCFVGMLQKCCKLQQQQQQKSICMNKLGQNMPAIPSFFQLCLFLSFS